MSEPDLRKLETEGVNRASENLDQLETLDILKVMNEEDRRVATAVHEVLPQVAQAVDTIVESLEGGGRVVLAGAGTSGRLAVLDASECPPTFGVEAELFEGVIAGGDLALRFAVEGAEDDREQGRRDLAAKLAPADVLVVLTASGRTPYCLGALEAADTIGAATIAVTCNAASPCEQAADLTICAEVGPEVLSGSTRLKAGTAQKMILNMLSTAAMVRRGRSYGNLMVGVRATNQKLKVRARTLVETIVGSIPGIDEALERAGFDVRNACLQLTHDLSVEAAATLLEEHDGFLRPALGASGDQTVPESS